MFSLHVKMGIVLSILNVKVLACIERGTRKFCENDLFAIKSDVCILLAKHYSSAHPIGFHFPFALYFLVDLLND